MEAAINYILPEIGTNWFKHILTNVDCTDMLSLHDCKKNLRCKDLRLLTSPDSHRRIQDTIIVDNCPEVAVYNPYNLIPIKDFKGEKEDNMLELLSRYLISLANDRENQKSNLNMS